MKERKLLILITLLFFSIGLVAQNQQKRPSVEEYNASKWKFLIEKSGLTTQEASRVEPIFKDYEQSMWKIFEENKAYFRFMRRTPAADAKINYEELNEKYVTFEIQKAQLLKSYQQKLQRVISAERTFHYLNADREFKQEMQNSGNRGRQGNK